MAQTQAGVQLQVAKSYTTNVAGRCIAGSGDHLWVMDYAPHQEGPGEQPGPTEYFLSAVSSCGVMMIEREARHRGVKLARADARIEAFRRTEPAGPHMTFARVEMQFTLTGPTQAEAEDLVAYYQRTCPLYGSVAEATPEVSVTVVASSV